MLKKTAIAFSALVLQLCAAAQYKVRVVVSGLPDYHKPADKLYLAGSFNNWNPADERYALKREGNASMLTLDLPKGFYEYKITRGSWESVESAASGLPTENRILRVEQDTSIQVAVAHWGDHFPKKASISTASQRVRIIDTAFFIPQLNRYRRVWIYLPKTYPTRSQKRSKDIPDGYPVIYMQDGQNLFDAATSAYGEWGIDEAMDSLPAERQCIVVGIDHGGDKRFNEYSPYDMEKFGKGEGAQYVDFLVHTLKPYIDKHYWTRKGAANTFIAGSSMGGLISFYAILQYPKVFGGAGVFSPSFWISNALKNLDPEKAKKVKGKIYFYAGRLEGESMVPDMLAVFSQMQQHSKAKMETVIRAEGRHNEAAWRKEFPLFYNWLLRK